jgi:hypothetical protein
MGLVCVFLGNIQRTRVSFIKAVQVILGQLVIKTNLTLWLVSGCFWDH